MFKVTALNHSLQVDGAQKHAETPKKIRIATPKQYKNVIESTES
jgi:hypothetical protein